MTRKWASISKGMFFAWGMSVGLIFLFLVPRDTAGRLQLTYARVFRWPLTMGSGVVRVSQTTAQRNVSPKEYEDLLKTCQQFQNASANLQAQLREAQSEIERLTRLRAKPGLEHMQPIPAKVITQTPDELTINEGQDSGVAVGQYVMSLTDTRLDDQCVIGTISIVYNKGATVKLITHPTSKIPAGIDKLNGLKVFLEGRGDGTARIRLVPTKHTIRAGDVIYAEKKQGFLDVPIIAGEIAQCKKDLQYPLVWDISVRPVCDFAALSDVVVIKAASVP
jgi:cell shape-determining protein MreC